MDQHQHPGSIDGLPSRPEPRRRGGAVTVAFVAAAGIAVVAALVLAGGSSEATALDSPDTAPTVETILAEQAVLEVPETAPVIQASTVDASEVGQEVIASVVTVQVGTTRGMTASGSGVVIDSSGGIVTNEHVVSAGTTYQVVLADGTVYPAELVGADAVTDLAVVRIGASGLTPINIGSSDAMTIGDPAIAVGSPLGLEGGPSLTVGVISALGREVDTGSGNVLYGMLQTDAPITEGSSGGALVDSDGRLVGITTAVGVSSVGVEGIGFATPVEVVTRVVGEIVSGGEATQPFLGITGSTAYEATGDGGERPYGVMVESVEAGSAAAAGGIEAGARITAVEGIAVDTMEDLIALLRRHGAGEEITLSVESGSGTHPLTIVLGDR